MADEKVRSVYQYDREVSLSLETFKKHRKRKIKRFRVELITAGWYKVAGEIKLYREEGGYTDQLIFQQDNPHFVLQGYVFKAE